MVSLAQRIISAVILDSLFISAYCFTHCTLWGNVPHHWSRAFYLWWRYLPFCWGIWTELMWLVCCRCMPHGVRLINSVSCIFNSTTDEAKKKLILHTMWNNKRYKFLLPEDVLLMNTAKWNISMSGDLLNFSCYLWLFTMENFSLRAETFLLLLLISPVSSGLFPNCIVYMGACSHP